MTDIKNKKNRNEKIEIELSNKHVNRRLLLFILFLGVGVVALGYGLNAAISTEKGWHEIEANATSDLNCATDFVFLYNLGAGGTSATVENKAITLAYTEAVEHAYKMFTNDQGYGDVNNIYYLNQHPNEEVVVEDTLYQAFELLAKYKNRNLYLAPVYMMYDDMFYAADESETVDYDPYVNEEVAAYYAEIAAFARDEASVEVELLGDNKVKLFVSEDYLKYAKENGITSFIDFFWMKNAFITDYLAECMIEKGYTLGSISSFDGFSRNLDDSDTSYSFNIYDKFEDEVLLAGVMQYKGAQSIVYLRDYMMNELDIRHYREMKNGETRNSYLAMEDGKCRSAIDSLVSYSKDVGCAEVLMNAAPIYIAEEFDEVAIGALAGERTIEEADEFSNEAATETKIYSVYCVDTKIQCNDENIKITDLYKKDGLKYESLLTNQ